MISKINKTLLFCVLLSLVSCKTQQDSKTPRWLDDIQYDSTVDKKTLSFVMIMIFINISI